MAWCASLCRPARGQPWEGDTTVTASAGLASFTGLTLSGTSAPLVLQVTSNGLTGIVTNPVTPVTPSRIAFATASLAVDESAGSATLQVVRSGGLSQAVSVTVATSGGTAVAGVNYTSINEVLNFAPGQASQDITIPVEDAGNLPRELTVNVVLSNPGGSAELGNPSTSTLEILNAARSTDTGKSSTAPLVTMDRIQLIRNRRHHVTEVLIGFSGALNPAQAVSMAQYELVRAGRHHSFTGRGTRLIKLWSAVYDAANNTVALTPKRPFAIGKPVELVVNGGPPSGLEAVTAA